MTNPFDLSGRTALVTGANRGLGRAFASALAHAGADVVVVARDTARNEEAAAAIAEETGRRATVVSADVTDPADAGRDPGPTIFSALSELGLKLVRVKRPVETLVIDHIEKPSDN